MLFRHLQRILLIFTILRLFLVWILLRKFLLRPELSRVNLNPDFLEAVSIWSLSPSVFKRLNCSIIWLHSWTCLHANINFTVVIKQIASLNTLVDHLRPLAGRGLDILIDSTNLRRDYHWSKIQSFFIIPAYLLHPPVLLIFLHALGKTSGGMVLVGPHVHNFVFHQVSCI